METNKKSIVKKWWFWAGLVVLLALIINLTASDSTKKQWAKEDSVKTAQYRIDSLEMVKKSWLPIHCKYLKAGKDTTIVSYTETDTWNTSSLIRHHFSNGIEFSRKAFAGDPSLKTVEFATWSVLKDRNGNLDTTLTIRNTFNRDKFTVVKWENFKDQSIYDQIERTAEDIYFHPAIKNSVTDDELRADLFLE
jgi:outer membrane receptor for monomeric catechols